MDVQARYVDSTLRQVFLGDYTDDVTALGTSLQVVSGLTGLDALADVRDLSANLSNWTWSWGHAGKTALNLLALAPVVGTFKYGDEAAAAVKGIRKELRASEAAVQQAQAIADASSVRPLYDVGIARDLAKTPLASAPQTAGARVWQHRQPRTGKPSDGFERG